MPLVSNILVAAHLACASVNDGSYFGEIDSSQLQVITEAQSVKKREDFYKLNQTVKPPLIGKSDFVPREMVEHLMRNKKDRALGVKYQTGDAITNAEGVMHTFATPLCPIKMTGYIRWLGKVSGKPFDGNQVWPLILSAAIHPDFEFDNVMLPLVRLGEESIEGSHLSSIKIPTAIEKSNESLRQAYDMSLLQHMIYHLSPDRRLPALSEVAESAICTEAQAKAYLETMIGRDLPQRPLHGIYVRTAKGHVISLEILFRVYVEQLRNEFKVLNPNAPQGYIYTISPPSIFSRELGGSSLQNRVQSLAFQSLGNQNLFSSMAAIAYDDYADPRMVPLLQKSLPHIRIMSSAELFDGSGQYIGPKGKALVIHNNSDAFGQNIETEGETSMDGVIGRNSDAALHLDRKKVDLVSFVQ